MAPSEQDEDSSWGNGGTQIPLVLAEGLLPVAFEFTGHILCRVVAGLRQGAHRQINQFLKIIISERCTRD